MAGQSIVHEEDELILLNSVVLAAFRCCPEKNMGCFSKGAAHERPSPMAPSFFIYIHAPY